MEDSRIKYRYKKREINSKSGYIHAIKGAEVSRPAGYSAEDIAASKQYYLIPIQMPELFLQHVLVDKISKIAEHGRKRKVSAVLGGSLDIDNYCTAGLLFEWVRPPQRVYSRAISRFQGI
ncbi:hypothetical protein JMS34_005002 [Salmonella enterica]|nr:hypothetical protein [Salmonella enterica]